MSKNRAKLVMVTRGCQMGKENLSTGLVGAETAWRCSRCNRHYGAFSAAKPIRIPSMISPVRSVGLEPTRGRTRTFSFLCRIGPHTGSISSVARFEVRERGSYVEDRTTT